MTKNNVEGSWALLVIRGMQWRVFSHLQEWLNERLKETKYGQGFWAPRTRKELLHIGDGGVKWPMYLENCSCSFLQSKTCIYDTTILFPGIYARKMRAFVYKMTCTKYLQHLIHNPQARKNPDDYSQMSGERITCIYE